MTLYQPSSPINVLLSWATRHSFIHEQHTHIVIIDDTALTTYALGDVKNYKQDDPLGPYSWTHPPSSSLLTEKRIITNIDTKCVTIIDTLFEM